MAWRPISWARICAPGGRFFDIGAHIGSVVSAVQRHVPTARIDAVEAIPEKAAQLRRSFPNIQVHGCALGETEGEVPFYINESQSGYSSLSSTAREPTDRIVRIVVQMRCLDQLAENGIIDTIKIDVEGAELDVLRGGRAVLSKHRPLIMFESAPPVHESYDDKLIPLFELLAGHQYEVLVPNRLAHLGPSMTCASFVESHYYPRRTTNYFAVPAERRTEFRDRARRIRGVQ